MYLHLKQYSMIVLSILLTLQLNAQETAAYKTYDNYPITKTPFVWSMKKEVAESEYAPLIRKALDEWTSARSKLQFVEENYSSKSRIRFKICSDPEKFEENIYAFCSSTFYPIENELRSKITINVPVIGEETSKELKQAILMHEIGHALGLSHTSIKNQIMSPDDSNIGYKLGEDDLAGIDNLYKDEAPDPEIRKSEATSDTEQLEP